MLAIVITIGVSIGVCSGGRIKYPGWDTFEEKSTEVSSEIAKGVADAVVHHVKGADCSSILVTNYLEIPSKSKTSYAAAIYTVPAGYGTRNQYLVWLRKPFKDKQYFHRKWERYLGGGYMIKGSLESVELLRGKLLPCLFVVSSGGGNTQTVYKRIYSLSNGVYLPMPHLILEYAGDGWGHSTSMGFSKSTVAFEDTDGDGTKEIVLDITEGRLREWEGVKPEVRKRKLMFKFQDGQYVQRGTDENIALPLLISEGSVPGRVRGLLTAHGFLTVNRVRRRHLNQGGEWDLLIRFRTRTVVTKDMGSYEPSRDAVVLEALTDRPVLAFVSEEENDAYHRIELIDFNNDGVEELVQHLYIGGRIFRLTSGRFDAEVPVHMPELSRERFNNFRRPHWNFADVDSDGVPELIVEGRRDSLVLQYTADGFHHVEGILSRPQ